MMMLRIGGIVNKAELGQVSMASNVKIEFKVPRNEIGVPSFRKTRLASTIQPLQWTPNPSVPGSIKAVKGSLPDDLWREPHTGVIMMRPLPLHAEYYGSRFAGGGLLGVQGVSDWNFNPLNIVNELHGIGVRLRTGRISIASAYIEYLVDASIMAILNQWGSTMVPMFTTKTPLEKNQGWSMWVHPNGIFNDRAVDYMAVHFGGRYTLRLRLNGTASLNALIGYDPDTGDAIWSEKAQFKYADSGVEHGQPFQITCVPFGFDYIAFVFTKANEPEKAARSSLNVGDKNVFLYKIWDKEDIAQTFDEATKQWIKYNSHNVTISVVKNLYNHTFQFARNYFPTDAVSIYAWPESMNEPIPGVVPTVQSYGFEPGNGLGSFSTITTGPLVNHKFQAYNPTTDFKIAPNFIFNATSDGLYSPELWSYDLLRDALIVVPDWEIEDVSTKWNYLRFIRGTDGEALSSEIGLTRVDNLFTKMLKPQADPVRVSIKNSAGTFVPVYEGYVELTHPTLELTHLHIKYECRDMWLRLNETFVDDFDFLDGKSVRDTIRLLILKAGFLDDDIEITDPDGLLASLSYSGFRDPNDQKAIDPGKSVGDVIRHIQTYFWSRPLRVIWRDGKWQIYLAPQYTYVPGTPPNYKFTAALTPVEAGMSDLTRWQNKIYKIESNLEFTTKPLEFNRLIVRTTTGVGSGAEGIQATITNVYGNSWFWKSVYDPTHAWFIGRTKSMVVMPPGAIAAQAVDDLECYGRTYWERYSRPLQPIEFRGQWLPDIHEDMFIWVTGKSPTDGLVSFGAYRIDHIDVDIRRDSPNTDTRFTFQARYTCYWVGKADSGIIPMFTTDENLPLRDV